MKWITSRPIFNIEGMNEEGKWKEFRESLPSISDE